MTVAELNAKFGVPTQISFQEGHGGFPEVVLKNAYGTATVALLGANVVDYRPVGEEPVVFRPAKRNYTREDPFHGGIPVCWPQFGGLAIPGMAAHGFARRMPFEVRGARHDADATEVTLGLSDSAETRALWPHAFDLEVKIILSRKLDLTLTTRNPGPEPFAFTAGFHPYLLVQERDRTSLKGLDGCPYIFADDMSEHVQKGDLAMTTATDHVFTLPPAARHVFRFVDAGFQRTVELEAAGGARLVVWNPGPKATMPDFQPDDWRRFVCVEPVTLWPKPPAPLPPGGVHELRVSIHVDRTSRMAEQPR